MAGPFIISMKLVGDATSGVAAVDQQRGALEKLSATAMGVQANTANVAAQFQDIFVTAGMGMSPLQIALQQGTQLSAALGNRGLGGTVSMLGAAFASVLSPVSLLTIAVVGLGSFAVQALMGMMASTDEATVSLEEHSKWLDEILSGYDAARDAAERASEAAIKLPQGVVVSDLRASLAEQAEAAKTLQERIDGTNASLAGTVEFVRELQATAMSTGGDGTALEAIITQIEYLGDLGLSTRATTEDLDAAMIAARELFNTADDPAIKDMADQVYQLAVQLRLAGGEAASTEAALASLQSVAFRGLGVGDAVSKLSGMRPELRSPREIADEVFGNAIGDARTTSEISALVAEYNGLIADLDEQERRRADLRSDRTGAKSSDKWETERQGLQQRIEQTQLETRLLGQSTFEVERQRAALDLLNQAKQAGIPITDEVLAQIGQMSTEYASAQVELEQATEAQRRFNEELDFYKGTFNSFFGDLKSGLQDGLSLWDAFANAGANALDKIADRALGMAADGIFDLIFGAITGGLTGGVNLGGLTHVGNFSIGGMATYAAGTSFHPGGLAKVHGEEIIELPRGTRVHTAQSSASMGGGGDTIFQVIDQRRGGGPVRQEKATGPNGEKIIRAIIRDEVRQASRRGAVGF